MYPLEGEASGQRGRCTIRGKAGGAQPPGVRGWDGVRPALEYADSGELRCEQCRGVRGRITQGPGAKPSSLDRT